jgi:hypothetical protein
MLASTGFPLAGGLMMAAGLLLAGILLLRTKYILGRSQQS